MSYEIKQLTKHTICDCGFPLMRAGIMPGTPYTVDMNGAVDLNFLCGGCGKARIIPFVPVMPRGYLPKVAFEGEPEFEKLLEAIDILGEPT